jgi:hypothetical protein
MLWYFRADLIVVGEATKQSCGYAELFPGLLRRIPARQWRF